MSDRRFDSKHIEKFRARLRAAQTGGAPLTREGKGAITNNRDVCQSVILLPKIEEIGIRKRAEHGLLFLASVGHAEGDQLLRSREWQRLEQDRVNYAEDCR